MFATKLSYGWVMLVLVSQATALGQLNPSDYGPPAVEYRPVPLRTIMPQRPPKVGCEGRPLCFMRPATTGSV
jgi:hypothetical protein